MKTMGVNREMKQAKRDKGISSPEKQIAEYYRKGKTEKLSPQKNPGRGGILYLMEEMSLLGTF